MNHSEIRDRLPSYLSPERHKTCELLKLFPSPSTLLLLVDVPKLFPSICIVVYFIGKLFHSPLWPRVRVHRLRLPTAARRETKIDNNDRGHSLVWTGEQNQMNGTKCCGGFCFLTFAPLSFFCFLQCFSLSVGLHPFLVYLWLGSVIWKFLLENAELCSHLLGPSLLPFNCLLQRWDTYKEHPLLS